MTAAETASVRQAPAPLKWINVSGGEMKHQGRVSSKYTDAKGAGVPLNGSIGVVVPS